MVVIKAAHRLQAFKTSEWFDSLSDQAKADYLEEHPDSKFNKHSSVVNKRPLSTEDKKRIEQLKSDIETAKEDLADFEESDDPEDAEYAERCRKTIKRNTEELKELMSRA